MNRSIMKLGVVLVVLYIALFAKLNWIQVVDKNSLDSNPLNTAQVRRISTDRVAQFSQPTEQ